MSKERKKSTGKAGFISWIAVTSFLLIFLIVLTVLENGLLYPIFTTVLGGKKPIFAGADEAYEKIYTSDYNNKDESVKAGNELNVKIEEEGAVLLLNEDGALPLKNGAKISVFGKNSVNLVLGGSGSGGGSSDGAATIFDGLKAGGFEYNEKLKKFYEGKSSGSGRSNNPELKDGTSSSPTLDIGETPMSMYPADVKASYRDYNDAAIVVISRLGGESWDLPRKQNTANGGVADRHYLELDANEEALLDEVTSRFETVIVMLNTLTSFQCDFIERYNNTETDKRIDALLWIGGPGKTGAKAIGALLNGEANPSGKTTDIYSKDFTKDPTWVNFGDGTQSNNDSPNTSYLENGKDAPGYNIVTYEEGVYLGYRYYETRDYEERKTNPSSSWYADNVIFPFGYGLSYTKFDQKITEVTGSLEDKGDLKISVEVENTGKKAGKDVVQLYVTKPYYPGGIEKSHVELVDYAKTEVLAGATDTTPGGKQTITFTVSAYDLASYDYNDANGNEFMGYELEHGDYIFYAGKTSHVTDAYDWKKVVLEKDYTWTNDPDNDAEGNEVVNRFTTDDYDDIQYRLSDVTVTGAENPRKGMSRTDFEKTFPTPLTKDEREFKMDELNGFEEKAKLQSFAHNNAVIKELAEKNGMPKTNAGGDVILHDLVAETGRADYDDKRWTALLDKLTFDEMLKLVNHGAFITSEIQSIGKNLTNDSDGPVGFVNFMPGAISDIFKGNTTFATEIVIGSTWNKQLAYQMGRIVGDNGLWGDQSGNNSLPYSGWYAPAVNLHRSPFSGRNFEYYSEDPVLSGKMAVNVITGAATKGVYTDLKHFALNDQETNRAGVSTFCTEQALRELYLKPFELAVKGKDRVELVNTTDEFKYNVEKHTGTTGMMSSFNRIGNKWTGGDYRLMTEVLRNEWGFKGVVICDYKTDNTFMDSRQMLYAGNDLILTSTENLMWTNANSGSAEDVTVLRQATKNILYAVANSNSIQFKIKGYIMEWWIIVTIVVDVLAFIGMGVWGFFAVRKFVRNRKNKQTDAAPAPETPAEG